MLSQYLARNELVEGEKSSLSFDQSSITFAQLIVRAAQKWFAKLQGDYNEHANVSESSNLFIRSNVSSRTSESGGQE